jgi:hypothetical protein
MRDNETTIIEYDFTAADHWRERVVTIAPCPGTPPDCAGPYPWRHERHACDAQSDPVTGEDVGVRIYCTCGFEGPLHPTESAAIEAFNAERGVATVALSDWLVHRRATDAAEVDLPF